MSNVVKFQKKEYDHRAVFLAEVQEIKADIERLQTLKTWSLAIGLAVVAGWMIGTLAAQI
jgi:hypothetical protein